MEDAQLRRIDFTLLMIFSSVMEHRQLTAAAGSLGLTQSALSHALRRLRDLVGEDLFIRRQLGVEPTEKAYQLIGPVDAILETARSALQPRPPFDPNADPEPVRLLLAGDEAALLTPILITHLMPLLPKATIESRTVPRESAGKLLADLAGDVAIGAFWAVPDGLEAATILEAGHSVIARRGHGSLKKKLSLKKYLAADHIAISGGGGQTAARGSVVDAALSSAGLARRIRATVPDVSSALSLVMDTDLIATMPTPLAPSLTGSLPIRIYPAPVDIAPLTLSVVWHGRRASDDRLQWLVGALKAIGRTLGKPRR
ncbi:MAG: LysR family transcriptional regulator [Pseudomonadota bacterium]